MKRLWVAPCLVMLALAGLAHGAPNVIAVNIDGVVHPITVEIVDRALRQAEEQGAAAVLLRLNTPGGLLEATRQLDEKIVSSKVPVIAYVTPSGGRAASAGFFILEAADVAAMAPGTNTGASSPVAMGGELDETMRKKVENDAAAWLRSITEKRGRNSDLAETTIREATSFTETQALEQNLIDMVAPSEAALLDRLDGQAVRRFDGSMETLELSGATISEYEPTVRQSIVSAVADPNIGFILLALGALGLYIEMSAPGLIVPGVFGGISLLLGLSSLAVMPINWIGAALLLLAVVLFVAEANITSHGILGIGGAVAMLLGALLLIDGPPELRIKFSTALGVTLPFAAITVFLVSLIVRAHRNKSVMNYGGMLDQIGEARTALAPAGKVFVRGEYWDAESDTPIEAGAKVRVLSMDGLKLKVAPKE